MTDRHTDLQAARELQQAREDALTEVLRDIGLTPGPTDPSPHPAA